MKQRAVFNINWEKFSNEDIGISESDSGWYVSVIIKDQDFDIGHDRFGPGFKTVDEALAHAEKWAKDRGMEFHRPYITAVATYEIDS